MSLTAATHLVDDLQQARLLSPVQLDAVQRELAHVSGARQLAEELVKRQWLTRFQARQALGGFASGLNIGPYRLLEVVGEGGMGMVFKAYDARLNRYVALKTIHNDVLAKFPEAAQRFHREAQAVAQLAHPNVVVLFEAAEADGVRYLAMEYVDGIDLHRMVQKQG